jgi:hypothetical protein
LFCQNPQLNISKIRMLVAELRRIRLLSRMMDISEAVRGDDVLQRPAKP